MAVSSTVIRAAVRGAPRDFVLYNLAASLCVDYAITMDSIEICSLEVRYADLNPVHDRRSPLCRAPNFRELRECAWLSKEHVLPT